ncbi:SDR family NAD(P)-dependent oxidoreductase [Deinococcus sp. Arct2-2]|uniref:SDR family NAD(P)-dependent oxidoreductase n=1 Tax=Deinococcus sp. Arct2-2 TaxID=2568653 RepID=UPI0010A402A2|nr:SDR family NAD(P)-dependent oxidoreductase [Deinococcus sp. Arct2-2]THF67885.1 SDR family NAD(P)-dependent oxidoreductase [Deinococcus sp. Arct2-2]
MPTPRIALVTGASSGIGQATALALHAAGFLVYASARRLSSLSELARQGLATVQLDVTEEGSMVRALDQIKAETGTVSVLVNNAGYGLNGPLEELALPDVREEFETNVFGLLRLSQLVLPDMRAQGWGRIIHVGSVGGSFTAPGAGAYHASKYAVEALSDAMRYEVQSFGVDVVLIKPTGVHSAFVGKINASLPQTGAKSPYATFKANMERATTQMFAGRAPGIIQPEQVARSIVQAATTRRPRTRYLVGTSAHVYLGLRRLVSDRMWDRLMTLQFPMTDRRTRSWMAGGTSPRPRP